MAGRPARPLRPQPLWVRVDQNRLKLAVFVVLFVCGSAVLLSLSLVGVPGAMVGAAGVWLGAWSPAWYAWRLLSAVAIACVALVGVGAVLAAVQLANAEDWVAARFRGREPSDDERAVLEGAVEDMSIAAGLAAKPRLLVLESDAVNAVALGTRKRPVLGVTSGLIRTFEPAEVRAAVAPLVARVVAGDVLFGTALAALMGPLRAVREVRRRGDDAEFAGDALSGCTDGCGGDGCGCLFDGLIGSDDASGCLIALAVSVFVAVTVVLTWVAVVTSAWIVTLWGRALHRTSYEKADAEGMLLLKDPTPTLRALGKAARTSNDIAAGDPSYDGIFYAATSGTKRVEKIELRRMARIAELLGPDGAAEYARFSLAEGRARTRNS